MDFRVYFNRMVAWTNLINHINADEFRLHHLVFRCVVYGQGVSDGNMEEQADTRKTVEGSLFLPIRRSSSSFVFSGFLIFLMATTQASKISEVRHFSKCITNISVSLHYTCSKKGSGHRLRLKILANCYILVMWFQILFI